jgi:hypothetical protein
MNKITSTEQFEEADTKTVSGPPYHTYPQTAHENHTHSERHQHMPNDIDNFSDDPLVTNMPSQHTESDYIHHTQPKITNWMVNRPSLQENKPLKTNFDPDKEAFGTPI